ncbi:hypothetical protein BU26DRAFT_520839 [Trematosphaeria pertusa]|uniref:Uncharacterized protein n=1 Tax=Trematosphaeria pertusa TaxID=390896 RepID=A0A6A6IDY2_9PLEO|nr:uncharacterized protein BU26DRAFT_520839 [Trematosphaeria pertusa]KAF2247780.1 hypothetical protein BU26DRAFT_520839 [Trematosphaeria pertusa]
MGAHPRAGARVPDINVTVQQLYWSRILWATRTDGIFGRPALYPALQELQASCNDTRKPVNDLVSAWNGYQTLTGRGNEGAVRSIRGISRQIWHRYDPERADRLANAQICKAASDARNAIPFVAEAAQALHTSVSSVSLSLEAVAKATYLWFDRDNIGTPDTKRLAKWAYQAMTASGLADYRQTLFDQADVNGKRQMMAVYMDVATASLSMHQSLLVVSAFREKVVWIDNYYYGVQVARKCGEMDEAAQTEPEARDGVAVLHGRFTAGLSAEEVVADMDTWGVQMTEVTLNGLR